MNIYKFWLISTYKMIIFLLYVLLSFGDPSMAVDFTRYTYTAENLTAAEYEKILRTDSTNLANMDVFICGIKMQLCSFNNTYLADSNYIKHKLDEDTDSGCIPLDNGCYFIKENYNGSRSVDIIFSNEKRTIVQILQTSLPLKTVRVGDNVTFFMYFTAPDSKIINVWLQCVTSYYGGFNHRDWQYEMTVDSSSTVIKMSLAINEVDIFDTGIYFMSIHVGKFQIDYQFLLYVPSKFTVKETKVIDKNTNQIHNSIFWQPKMFYEVQCLVEGGHSDKDTFQAYVKPCSFSDNCSWKQVTDNISLVVGNSFFNKKMSFKIQATKQIRSYKITYDNDTCVEGFYYPSYVSNGIFMESLPAVFIGETMEIKCFYDENYFLFDHWNVNENVDVNETSAKYSIINTRRNFDSVIRLQVRNLTTEDSGTYHCLFKLVGTHSSHIRDLHAKYVIPSSHVFVSKPEAPYFASTSNEIFRITDGQVKILQCIGEGNPKPSILWYDQWDHIVGNETDLLIPADSSWYKCKIQNKFGEQYKNFIVIGKGKPKLIVAVIVLAFAVTLLLILIAVFSVQKTLQKRELKSKLIHLQQLLSSSSFISLETLGYDQLSVNNIGLHDLYIDPNRYIRKDSLTIETDQPLGEGCFGSVYKGSLKCDYQSDPIVVAVKAPRIKHDYKHYSALVAELMIMSHIGSHINLLDVYGAVIENLNAGELFVVFEYCQNGSLLSYLKNKRFVDEFTLDYQNDYYVRNYDRQLSEKVSCLVDSNGPSGYPFNDDVIFTCNLLQYAYQIADGMKYLTSKHVVHRDLALRNILLTNNHIVKIADFGLALDKVYNPKIPTCERLPLKWMPPESILSKDFSTYSDIWSYGIVLWELFTLGMEPFQDVRIFDEQSVNSFCDSLINGKKLNCPIYAPAIIYTLMKDCWMIEKENRPSFEECKKVCGCFLNDNFRLASEALMTVLTKFQPYINVKESPIREKSSPKENFTYFIMTE